MLTKRFDIAKTLVIQTGELLRSVYTDQKQIQHKGKIDLLTEYDLRSETLLTAGIQKNFSADTVVSEESRQQTNQNEYWLIDPIDGTTNFAHGLPEFTICVAYMHRTEPLIGIIYNPVREEFFHAIKGEGAYLNNQSIRVSTQSDLLQSLLSTGFPYDPDHTEFDIFGAWNKIFYKSRGIRHFGCASMNAAYLAAGRLEGYWESSFNPWDLAAGALLVTEAGGKVTRIDGKPNPLSEPCSILATNGSIHTEMLNLLNNL
jgi:myo-inositol-1(or 4)-monophosphatase